MKILKDLTVATLTLLLTIVAIPAKLFLLLIQSLIAVINGEIENFFREREYIWTVAIDEYKRLLHEENITDITTRSYTMKDGTNFILKSGVENGKNVFEILEEKPGK